MKRNSVLFIVTSLFLCASLFFGMLFFGTSDAIANEIPSPEPKLLTKDGSINDRWLSQAAGWFADRFFLRREMITLNARINAFLGASSSEQVLLGKNGWLFYAPTMQDYTGIQTLSQRDLNAVAHNLALMLETCEKNHIQFLFVCPPNKNTLYPQNMPETGIISSEHNLHRLTELLKAEGIPAADLMHAFKSESRILYFAHDSHWNSQGAALAADTILHALGRGSNYFTDSFSRVQPHAGDLYQMLYPADTDPETDPVYGKGLNVSFRDGSGHQPDSISIKTNGTGSGKLLMYRDSFGNLLYPYLADSFESAEFSRSVTYDLTLTNSEKPDTIIIELVERNLGYLLQNTPLMEAPKRTISYSETDGCIPVNRTTSSRFPGYTLWQGHISEDSPVFVLTEENSYECFLTADGGFAAWIPEEETVTHGVWNCSGTMLAHRLQYQ